MIEDATGGWRLGLSRQEEQKQEVPKLTGNGRDTKRKLFLFLRRKALKHQRNAGEQIFRYWEQTLLEGNLQ